MCSQLEARHFPRQGIPIFSRHMLPIENTDEKRRKRHLEGDISPEHENINPMQQVEEEKRFLLFVSKNIYPMRKREAS